MADQKISELTALTGANVADDDAIAIVDTSATETKKIVFSELKNALDTATGFVRITGDTMTGNLSMGDNVKAIFGAGSDLQIYHDSASGQSIIHENGPSVLKIRATDFRISNADNTADYLSANNGAEVSIRYNGAVKLATTSTGIDVTGNVTMATGGSIVAGGVNDLILNAGESGTPDIYLQSGSSTKVKIEGSNGNVGIGTSSPMVALNVHDSTNARIALTNSSTGQTFPDGFELLATGLDAYVQNRSNGNMVFTTNNTEAMRIDSSGRVGIGISPAAVSDSTGTDSLQLGGSFLIHFDEDGAGTTSLNNNVYWNGSANKALFTGSSSQYYQDGGTHVWRYGASTSAGSTVTMSEAMRIDSSGNVGIGTSSPKRQIHLHNTSAASTKIQITNSATGSGTDGEGFQIGIGGAGQATIEQRENQPMEFYTNNTERMRIDSSGNVGIGTSSPQLDFVVSNNGAQGFEVNSSGLISGGIDVLSYNRSTSAYAPIYNNASYHVWATSTTERMRIDSSGNLGIGGVPTNASDHKSLALFGNASTGAGFIEFNDTSGNADAAIFADNGNLFINADYDNATANSSILFRVDGSSEKMRITSGGYLALGNTLIPTSGTAGVSLSPDGNVHCGVTGTSAADVARFDNANGRVGSITASGSSTSYNETSDHRLKENVVELTGATERLKQLNPSRFNFIADADTTVDGFLAHEVQSVVPEAVTGTHNEVDGEGNPVYQGIDKSKLVPLLVATIQELEARITALENA